MARKKIREYDSKRILKEHLKRISGIDLAGHSAQVTESTDFTELANTESWLNSTRLVVKPDMLFGKRGKSGLVALNLDLAGVESFVKERLGKEVEMSGTKGPITTFIVEPFVPHEDEYYLSIMSNRLGCDISFSECGGVEIEENWDKVKTIFVPTDTAFSSELCAPLIATLPLELHGSLSGEAKGGPLVQAIWPFYLDFTLIEMNPFTFVKGAPYPLDMRGELDDTATFKNFKKWGNLEFPQPFGRLMSPAESRIHAMDEKALLEVLGARARGAVLVCKWGPSGCNVRSPLPIHASSVSPELEPTGASLKLTILNPAGRIWTMVAGGGASVIYSDTVGDLGYAHELGNYAEYSGAPNEEETLQYARTLIDCATANPDGKKRALVIGGGIANFTDVAATFSGIIRALREKESQLKAAQMHLYVRRGGPNYQKALDMMRRLSTDINVPIEVYGPEASMTGICKQAIQYIEATA
eukprot:jgi/Mesen1/8185/ME000044S07451